MRRAVETLGPDWTLRRVAEATGENYKNVLRWISGETTLPAEFLVRFLAQVPVDHQYVLFGVDRSVSGGSRRAEERDVSPAPIGDQERRELLQLAAELTSAIARGRTPQSRRTPVPWHEITQEIERQARSDEAGDAGAGIGK